jgi:RNA polymerase sigma factor (sigma-70 family)
MDRAAEKALVRGLVAMNGDAWEAFCREYARPLLSFVELCLGCDRPRAEDVVQMTFLRCVKSIGTFGPDRGSLLGWLKAVARNEAHTLLRQETAGPGNPSLSSVPPHIADQILNTIDASPLPDDVLARRDVKAAVQEALMAMRPRQRGVLIAKYVDGRKVSEIAALLGLSEKAVESLLTRSRESLRRALARKMGGRVEVFG